MARAIATWTFGIAALNELVEKCNHSSTADCVDLLVTSIKTVEDDPSTGCYVVGRGGFPNSAGVCEFDAAVMRGSDCSFAGVAALQSIPTPISVARSVLDCSPHSLLVGEGARQFAVSQGHVCEPESLVQRHQQQQPPAPQMPDEPRHPSPAPSMQPQPLQQQQQPHHTEEESVAFRSAKELPVKDTLCLIVQDKHGNIAAGGSTSGKPYKHPGRVGDVPLPGCGLYADNEVGAACCTGDGDNIARFCPAFQVVQLMAQGLSPEVSCTEVIRRIEGRLTRCGASMFDIGIVSMNKHGATGAATSISDWTDPATGRQFKGFPYAVWTEGSQPLVKVVGSCTHGQQATIHYKPWSPV